MIATQPKAPTASTIEKCLICNSNEIHPIDGFEHAYLHQCSDCNFVFSNRIPLKSELDEIYKDEFNHTTYFSPITIKRYEKLLADFEPYRKTNRILDVGAGCGFFMETAKKNGWDVVGTEISELCIDQCNKKGLDIFRGDIKAINFDPEQFDVIVGLEIIEHVPDPKGMLTEIYRLLRKGGLLYITTPNFNAINRYRLKGQYDVVNYPIHLTYFTPKTLRNTAKSIGFNPKKICTTGYSITRVKTSKGTSNQAYISETSDDEMLRQKIEGNVLLKLGKSILNGALNLFKVGDSLKAYLVK